MSLELESLNLLVYFKFRYFNGLTIDEANDKSSFVGPLEPKIVYFAHFAPKLWQNFSRHFMHKIYA